VARELKSPRCSADGILRCPSAVEADHVLAVLGVITVRPAKCGDINTKFLDEDLEVG
jgi:hypothetical protein